MSIFDLVLTGVSEIREKILNNNDQIEENANLGYFRVIFGLFLACYDPRISAQSSQWVYLT